MNKKRIDLTGQNMNQALDVFYEYNFKWLQIKKEKFNLIQDAKSLFYFMKLIHHSLPEAKSLLQVFQVLQLCLNY